MKIVFALIGAVLGGMAAEWPGVLFGAALGWLVAVQVFLQRQVDALQKTVSELRRAAPAKEQTAASMNAEQATPVQRTSVPFAPASSVEPSISVEPIAISRNTVVAPTRPHADVTAPRKMVSAQRPATPTQPDVFDHMVAWLKNWFTSGNTLVRVGAVVLFFGVSFLLKYAAEHSHVPIEARIGGVALGAIVLLVLGWRLRGKRSGYALALQGTAVGVLYLVIFAAFRLYSLLPATLAFAMLIAMCALASALAVLQNSMWFALLGAGGGFLAPIAVSTGQGSHVALFSYYLLLNLGILAVAWFKAWRPLNLLGFVATFGIGTAWGALQYQSALFNSTEPFLVAFFLLFVAIAVLHAVRQSPELKGYGLKGYVDGTLVFGNPLVAFGLQVGLLRPDRYALAISAVAVSALYLGLAAAITRSAKSGLHTLAQAFWALGVVFVTLAVPLALNGHWTAATWSMEGVAIVWLGLKQQRKLPRVFGVLLQLAAAAALWDALSQSLFWNEQSIWLNGVLLSVAAVFTAALLLRHRDITTWYERPVAIALFFWGVLWWLVTWMSELPRHLPDDLEVHALYVMVMLTAVVCSAISRRMVPGSALRFVQLTALCALPMLVWFALIDCLNLTHPAAHGGWWAWPTCFAAVYWLLWRDETSCGDDTRDWLHTAMCWLLLAMLGWQLAWCADTWIAGGSAWRGAVRVLIPLLALSRMPVLVQRVSWPFGARAHAYGFLVSTGVVLYLLWWSITSLGQIGDTAPLPYIPLLNPLDLAQVAVGLSIWHWWRNTGRNADNWRDVLAEFQHVVRIAAGALGFFWLNAMLLRTLHHWCDVPMNAEVMWSSTLVQTSLSIFWTVLALLAMVMATRWSQRLLWLIGATLMGVVVVKLFLIDLSRIGTVARIVSFMGVGGLMLLIGYLAPLPPGHNNERQEEQGN